MPKLEDKKIYISPNIYLYNNKKLYYNNETEDIKINNKNWTKFLEEYGWYSLGKTWHTELNVIKVDKYGELDCGGDGDCLFLAIIEGLKKHNNFENELTVGELRILVSDQITNDNFNIILETYKLEYDNGEFDGDWNPEEIKSIQEFKNEIRKEGNSFWGDHIIIQLLEKALDINIIIFLYENDFEDNYRIQSSNGNICKDKKTVFISYSLNSHYQLIGYFNGDIMKTQFDFFEIPREIIEKLKDNRCQFNNLT